MSSPDSHSHGTLISQEHVGQYDADALRMATERVVTRALELNASDVHLDIEPYHTRVRFRVDGLLVEPTDVLRPEDCRGMLSYIARLSGKETTAELINGSTNIELNIQGLPARFACVPRERGGALVIHLSQPTPVPLEGCGLLPEQLADIEYVLLKRSAGLSLICGPTGSGKTATQQAIVDRYEKIFPAHAVYEQGNPIELRVPTRIQSEQSGECSMADFFSLARSRNAAMIVVSELRTREEMIAALDAARSAHVIATFHTLNVGSTIQRLVKNGLPLDRLLPKINLLISQRLVRRLCSLCKEPEEAGSRRCRPVGCPLCFSRGYMNRLPIAEVLRLGTLTRERISSLAMEHPLAEALRLTLGKLEGRGQFIPLEQVALRLIESGLTTTREVERVLRLSATI